MADVNVTSYYEKPVVACATCGRTDTNLVGILIRGEEVGAIMECPLCSTRIDDIILKVSVPTPPTP